MKITRQIFANKIADYLHLSRFNASTNHVVPA